MLDRMFALTMLFVLLGCTAGTAQPDQLLDAPVIHQAITTCEGRYDDHRLTTFAQIAECERDLVVPQLQRDRPRQSGLYAVLSDDKIELYREVDRGRLSKSEADRRYAVEVDNRISIIRSMRRI